MPLKCVRGEQGNIKGKVFALPSPAPKFHNINSKTLKSSTTLLQCGLPTVSQLPLGPFICSGLGSSLASGESLLLHGLQGHCCLTLVCTTGCRGSSAALPGARPLLPSFLPLGSVELFLSTSSLSAAL